MLGVATAECHRPRVMLFTVSSFASSNDSSLLKLHVDEHRCSTALELAFDRTRCLLA